MGLAGCSGGGGNDGNGGETTASGGGNDTASGGGNDTTTAASSGEEELDLSAIEPDGPQGAGPTGAEPQPTSTLNLSEEQVSTVREEGMTVSVVLQYLTSDWIRLVRRGMQSQFVNLDVDVEGVYGVDFQADQQVELLETLASRADELDAVVVYPVDPTAVVEPIRQLREEGVEIVIITNTPPELEHGEDFAGMVTVDNYGLGLISGRILRQRVGEGKVGMIEQGPQLYVIDERERAVRSVMEDADGIELVTNSFNDAGETYELTQNMLTANPDMQGLWTPWASPPANEAVSAIQSTSGVADDFIHTTVDLNQQQAQIIAERGVTKGIGAGDPFGIGANLIKMAAHASVLGNETPPYVAVGTNAVVRRNLREMYQEILREEPPEAVTSAYDN
jgi:ribose transport system substrate-binding protein